MTSHRQPAGRAHTLGLNHVNLVVADRERSIRFYEHGLGLEIQRVTDDVTFLSTPGVNDLLALQLAGGPLDRASGRNRAPGDSGGVDHIGFDVESSDVLALVKRSAIDAGGRELMRITEEGRPIVFLSDPDGYVIQLSTT